MSDFRWVPGTTDTKWQPPKAVIGGTDSDGSIILVGRSNHCGDNLAVKIVMTRREAYVAYGGREIPVKSFEFLTGRGFKWVIRSNGYIPEHAVSTGQTANGEPLFIGRVHYNGSITVGKVQPSHKCCYIPYGGNEISAKSYEVLVQYPRACWVSSINDSSVEAGYDVDGARIFVGRVHYNGNVLPAKVITRNWEKHVFIPFKGREVYITREHKCEILCGSNFSWIQSRSGIAHANAYPGGRTEDGEVLYIGRVCHRNSLTPGMIRPSHGCLYIPFGNAELKFASYEILVTD